MSTKASNLITSQINTKHKISTTAFQNNLPNKSMTTTKDNENFKTPKSLKLMVGGKKALLSAAFAGRGRHRKQSEEL